MDITIEEIKSKIIKNNLFKNSDLDSWLLAEKLAISEVELSLFIKDETDLTVKDFINELRIQEVIELMNKTIIFHPVSYYYKISGFKSRSPFDRVFKQKAGMTVRNYIAKLKKDEL